MKFIFTCPETHKDFETDAYRIIEDKGIRTNPSGPRVWAARVRLSAPCPLCGGMHTYNREDLPCPFSSPADQDGFRSNQANCDNGDADP